MEMFINKDKYVNKHSNSEITISGGHVFGGGHHQHWAGIGHKWTYTIYQAVVNYHMCVGSLLAVDWEGDFFGV